MGWALTKGGGSYGPGVLFGVDLVPLHHTLLISDGKVTLQYILLVGFSNSPTLTPTVIQS